MAEEEDEVDTLQPTRRPTRNIVRHTESTSASLASHHETKKASQATASASNIVLINNESSLPADAMDSSDGGRSTSRQAHILLNSCLLTLGMSAIFTTMLMQYNRGFVEGAIASTLTAHSIHYSPPPLSSPPQLPPSPIPSVPPSLPPPPLPSSSSPLPSTPPLTPPAQPPLASPRPPPSPVSMTISCWEFYGQLEELPAFETLGPPTASMAVDYVDHRNEYHPTVGGHTFTDSFACRLVGAFLAPANGTATFFSRSDDASKIFVRIANTASSGSAFRLVVDDHGVHGTQKHSGTIELVDGEYYEVVATYFNMGYGSSWSVSWTPPGSSMEVLFTASAFQPPSPPTPPSTPPAPPYVDLVVAAYAENLTFVESMLNRMPRSTLHLYCKGVILQDPRCIRIGNYAGESYAYVSHIVANYDSLAPITIFSLGSILKSEWSFFKCKKLNYIVANLQTVDDQDSFPEYGTVAMTSPSGGDHDSFKYHFTLSSYRAHVGAQPARLCRASHRPLGEWYREVIDPDWGRARDLGMAYNSIFAARREQIRFWDLATWQRLKAEFERCNEGEPQELGHYMERTWKALLDVRGGHRSGRQPLRYAWECPAELIEVSRAISRDQGTVAVDRMREGCQIFHPC